MRDIEVDPPKVNFWSFPCVERSDTWNWYHQACGTRKMGASRMPRQGLHSPTKSVRYYLYLWCFRTSWNFSNLIFAPLYSTLWRRMTLTFPRSLCLASQKTTITQLPHKPLPPLPLMVPTYLPPLWVMPHHRRITKDFSPCLSPF